MYTSLSSMFLLSDSGTQPVLIILHQELNRFIIVANIIKFMVEELLQ
jgi:translation initiation factor 2B subunit (eIF-2B alpha/beta/delta family)